MVTKTDLVTKILTNEHGIADQNGYQNRLADHNHDFGAGPTTREVVVPSGRKGGGAASKQGRNKK